MSRLSDPSGDTWPLCVPTKARVRRHRGSGGEGVAVKGLGRAAEQFANFDARVSKVVQAVVGRGIPLTQATDGLPGIFTNFQSS